MPLAVAASRLAATGAIFTAITLACDYIHCSQSRMLALFGCSSRHYLPGEGELDECAFVIAPYSKHGTWLFNDERRNLVEEPLVAAAPETIAEIVADIPNAKAGFRLTFLQGPFPSASTNSRSRASDRRNTRKRIPRSGRSSYSAMLVLPGRVASERPSGKRRQLGKP